MMNTEFSVTTGLSNDLVSKSDVTSNPDYSSFLKLLVAQLKHQDPVNPADSSQFIGQLAAFSNVEQGIQANAKLAQIISSSAFASAPHLLGKNFVSEDGMTSGRIVGVTWENGRVTVDLGDGVYHDVQSGSLR